MEDTCSEWNSNEKASSSLAVESSGDFGSGDPLPSDDEDGDVLNDEEEMGDDDDDEYEVDDEDGYLS